MNRLPGFFCVLLLLWSCQGRETQQAQFYPVDNVLSDQVYALTDANASLEKIAVLGGEESKVRYVPDTTGWKKELEIFRQVNMINKPVNRGLYKVSQRPVDKDHLSVLTFEATEDLPVEYLKVYFERNPENVRTFEAKLKEQNSMYEASRILTVNFKNHKDKLLISGYTVKGGQKMFLGDSVFYNITATISVSD